MTPNQLLPQHLADGDGAAYWFIGSLSVVKATSESTGGSYSLTYDVSPPGHATPYHSHRVEDEAFWVLAGEFQFVCDGKKTTVKPGGYIFLPRGIPHGIRVTSETPAVKLTMAMPGDGFQNMMIEMADPTTKLELPEPKAPDMEKLFRLCEKYQIDILGPLPE